MYYHLVRIGVQRHWKQQEYTYESDVKLTKGTIVRVPFGKKKKIGIVSAVVKKPAFDTKPIIDIYTLRFSRQWYEFMRWYEAYYAVSPSEAVGQFLPSYLQKIREEPLTSTSVIHETPLPAMTPAQTRVVKEIGATKKPVVLHGVTASGKTRIYLELIQQQLQKNMNVLVLYPEIAVTPQIAHEIEKIAHIIVFHSAQTDAERSHAWSRIAQSSEPLVIIGPRSCLFLPFASLGMVIVDEAHDAAYKQDTHPRYHGLYVAAGLAKAYDAQLLLGSATPPITETEHIISNGGSLVCLHEKALAPSEASEQRIIDLRQKKLFTRHSLLSDALLDAVRSAMKNEKQSLLFLNRRGTSKIVICSNTSCDWLAVCDRCELPLTFHHDSYQLICHTCGKKSAMPTSCPTCGSEISLRSLGSKAVVEEVKKLFPQARIARYDSDTKKDASLHSTYDAVKEGSIDIMIGTQQIIKGLDLPRLSVVGILQADLSLRFPDFSSEERTFQLISQASGRVGRGHAKAQVIVQTFQPDAPVIATALQEDWHSFREQELLARKNHALPPYRHIATFHFRERSQTTAFKKAETFRKRIKEAYPEIVIEGPVESFHRRIGQHFYVQLHLKSSSRTQLLHVIPLASEDVLVDLDPISLL